MKIEFEIWNKRWGRFATENEVNKHLKVNPIGRGFIDRVIITTTNDDIEIRGITAVRERKTIECKKCGNFHLNIHKCEDFLGGG